MAVLACGPAGSDANQRVTTGTPDAPAWQLDLVATIAPGGDSSFARIRSLAVDTAGNVYVADQGANHIRVFDSLGRAVRTIGREGRGPGEFLDIYSLAWIGDTLAVLDPMNARIQLLDRDGGWIASLPAQALTGSTVRLFQTGDDFFQMGFHLTEGIPRYYVRGGPEPPHDTLSPPDEIDRREHFVVCVHENDGGISSFGSPFASRRIVSISPERHLVIAESAEYRISFTDPAGDVVRVAAFDAAPIPVSDAEWDSVLADLGRFKEQIGPADCQPSEPPRDAARPALRSIEFDDRDRMWVEAASPSGYRFDVYDASGEAVGSVPAPERNPGVPFVVRGGRLYVATMEESGDQAVRIYRIVGDSGDTDQSKAGSR